MIVESIQTSIFRPGDDLVSFIVTHVAKEKVREQMVLAITSKIVSLAENQLVDASSIDKLSLVQREADHFLAEVGYGCQLTIKHGLFIPSAGIDESNSESGAYILFPKDPFQSAVDLCRALRETWSLRQLGILITDSHTTPLRRGVTGIALAHAGFEAVKSLVGTQDLFGRELKMTNINYADGLAASTVMLMGEGAESRPFAIAYDSGVEFSEVLPPKTAAGQLQMKLEDDLYFPFFESLLK